MPPSSTNSIRLKLKAILSRKYKPSKFLIQEKINWGLRVTETMEEDNGINGVEKNDKSMVANIAPTSVATVAVSPIFVR